MSVGRCAANVSSPKRKSARARCPFVGTRITPCTHERRVRRRRHRRRRRRRSLEDEHQNRNGHTRDHSPTHRRPPLPGDDRRRAPFHPEAHARHGRAQPQDALERARRVFRRRVVRETGLGRGEGARDRAVQERLREDCRSSATPYP